MIVWRSPLLAVANIQFPQKIRVLAIKDKEKQTLQSCREDLGAGHSHNGTVYHQCSISPQVNPTTWLICGSIANCEMGAHEKHLFDVNKKSWAYI